MLVRGLSQEVGKDWGKNLLSKLYIIACYMCVYHCECEKQKPFFKAYEDRPRSLKEGTMTLRQND